MFSINIKLQFYPQIKQIDADFKAGGFDETLSQKVTQVFLISAGLILISAGLILINLCNLRTAAFSEIISLQGFTQ